MSQEFTRPYWWYIASKPTHDVDYFKNLTRCIFQAGLNWVVVDKKWLNFIEAFNNFNISKIALYDDKDFTRLIETPSIIRNKKKILATIHNAKEFQRITKEFGSFGQWLDGLDKANNYSEVVKQIIAKFKHVGKMTAHTFLHSVGEPIDYDAVMLGAHP